MSTTAQIESLLVWARFPVLPVEYYTGKWLEKAGDRTVKVDRVIEPHCWLHAADL